MNNIIETAKREIAILDNNKPEGTHIKTGDIRKLSAKLFKKVPNKELDDVFCLCETLLEEYSWALGVIAFDWAFRMKKQYTKDTYNIFFSWLKKYVRGWGDCDDFCTHAFGTLLMQNKELFQNVINWTADQEFWVRRASAVILIPAVLHDDYDGLRPLEIADKLMNDENELVCKGYGWMLKSLSQVNEKIVIDYLLEKHEAMPRVAFRYAIEKMDKETRNYLMGL